MSQDCIFCKIVKGEAPSFKVWEDDKHLAFLDIFPNTYGETLVITKEHHDSYAFDLSDEVLSGITLAAKKVGKLLDSKLPDVGRTALVYEGYGVNHIHAKLFPMHGTAQKDWQPINSDRIDKYFEKYEGYISTHMYKRGDDAKLTELAQKIRG